MLKSLAYGVNKLADGDMSIILLSGFDCNDEPMQHDIPEKAVIKRLEDGTLPCSIKVFLDAVSDADRYKVEISTTPDDPKSWSTVTDLGSLKKLEINNLVALQKVYVRVSAGNTHGWGIPSEPMAFIPR